MSKNHGSVKLVEGLLGHNVAPLKPNVKKGLGGVGFFFFLLNFDENFFFFLKRKCAAPNPGVSLTTGQPKKTCRYRVPRYHTHMSQISRPIPTYLIHNIQKYMIDYNHNLFTVPLIPKMCTCFGSA